MNNVNEKNAEWRVVVIFESGVRFLFCFFGATLLITVLLAMFLFYALQYSILRDARLESENTTGTVQYVAKINKYTTVH